MTEPESRELVELDAEECATLLALEPVGRVAVAGADGAPEIVPVNFALRDGDPVFHSHDGLLLDRLLGKPVSLQVDRFDWFHRTGWSVLVTGVAELVDPEDAELVEAADGERDEHDLDTWVAWEHPRLVRVRTQRITGRRIELHQIPLDGRGYL